MISLLLVTMAAFFNAVMDAVENENFFESVFRDLNQRFWYKRESWKYATKVFGYRLDAWHIAKSCMLVCLSASIYCEQFSNQILHSGNVFLDILIDTVIAGIIWILSFNLFYHRIFKVK